MRRIVCIGSNKYYDKMKEKLEAIKGTHSDLLPQDIYDITYPSYCDDPKENMTERDYNGLLYRHLAKIDTADLTVEDIIKQSLKLF